MYLRRTGLTFRVVHAGAARACLWKRGWEKCTTIANSPPFYQAGTASFSLRIYDVSLQRRLLPRYQLLRQVRLAVCPCYHSTPASTISRETVKHPASFWTPIIGGIRRIWRVSLLLCSCTLPEGRIRAAPTTAYSIALTRARFRDRRTKGQTRRGHRERPAVIKSLWWLPTTTGYQRTIGPLDSETVVVRKVVWHGNRLRIAGD